MRLSAAFTLMLLFAIPALAHKSSDAYLTLQRDNQSVTGRWDFALRDLELAVGIDANGDGEITWGELRQKQAAIVEYLAPRLVVSSGGSPCAMRIHGLQVDTHSDGTYAVLQLSGECSQAGPTLTIAYSAMFEFDPQHRGLLNLVEDGGSRSVVFSTDTPLQVVGAAVSGPLRQFETYVREGAWHIWFGFDHILFLISLLLPAVLVRRDGVWQSAPNFRSAFWDVLRIVTAFTVAHSITLTLAALDVVRLPSRFVESAIAVSVVLAALNNIVTVVDRRRWIVAFFFGLVHGFGFAAALQDLGLPTGSLVLSLAGFNLGVELGQLVIVGLLLPLGFALRRTVLYRRVVLKGGSFAIAALAGVWLVERALDLSLFDRLT